MGELNQFQGLSELEKGIMIFLSKMTLRPNEWKAWGVIRDWVKASPACGLQGVADNSLNVKVTRALTRLEKRGLVTKLYEGRNTFYTVASDEIRDAVKAYFDVLGSWLLMPIIIELPDHEVKDYEEFKEYVMDTPRFERSLLQEYDKFKTRYEASKASQ